MPKLAFASPAQFDDDSVLRFEESEDFSNYPTKPTPSSNGTDEDPYGNLKTKQEELLHLRHELEKKERETTELEARRQKEDRFATGRRDMCERLARTLTRLERELYNSQKAIEEITITRSNFERHLDILRAQQPEAWQRGNMDANLDHALASVEDAEDEFAKSMRRLNSVLPNDDSTPLSGNEAASGMTGMPADFRACVRMGFAFTLPLAIIVAVTLVAVKILFR